MKKLIIAFYAVVATSVANAMDFYVGNKISYAYTKHSDDGPMGMNFSDSGIRNKIAAGVSLDSEMLHGGFRAELEYGFGTSMTGEDYQNYGVVQQTRRIQRNTQTFFINGYYDFMATERIMPFVGIGAGMSYNLLDTYSRITGMMEREAESRTTDKHFAYNLQIGVAYKLTDNWTMDAGYRYTNLYDKRYDYSNLGSFGYDRHIVISSHELLLGARYDF